MNRVLSYVGLCCLAIMMTACSEIELGSHMYKKFSRSGQSTAGSLKVGKPYTIGGNTYYPKEIYDYVETGIASWYGPGFHGKKTASGERYDQNELTAAHRTLQMPSLIKVTNLDNGTSVVVRVNDRGPFAHGRIIDVSNRAAELLGMVRTGTARVRLELLEDESRALAHAARNGRSTKGVEVAYNQTGKLPLSYIAPTEFVMSDVSSSESDLAQAAKDNSVRGHYHESHFYPNPVVDKEIVSSTQLFVQAGSFGQLDNARRLAEKLGKIANSSVDPVSYSGRMLYKVRLGPLDSIRAADNVLSQVLASGQSDARIVVQ